MHCSAACSMLCANHHVFSVKWRFKQLVMSVYTCCHAAHTSMQHCCMPAVPPAISHIIFGCWAILSHLYAFLKSRCSHGLLQIMCPAGACANSEEILCGKCTAILDKDGKNIIKGVVAFEGVAEPTVSKLPFGEAKLTDSPHILIQAFGCSGAWHSGM